MKKTQDTLQGTLNLLILRTVANGPNHGFGIAQAIAETSEGLLRVEEGSLYPALHRLEREHLLAAEWRATENARRARYYRLTPAGRKALEEAERRWTKVADGVSKVLRWA